MRDLETYLALCEAATPGPREFDEYGIIYRKNEQNGIDILFSRWADGNWYCGKIADWKLAAAARTGWPKTIKRAMAMEARTKELETALKIAAKTIAMINTEMVDCPRDLSAQSWPCVHQGCQLEQRTRCWKHFFLEQAIILEQVAGAKEEV